jgi:hypothetical protein
VSHRVRKILAVTAGLVVLTTAEAVASDHIGGGWPYSSQPHTRSYTFAAVGDIACEPNDEENAANPDALKCNGADIGGYAAEYATAKQATAMHPDAIALLGDEQYQVGKLSDFEQSFEQTWGGLKFLERPAPGNHEYYAYAKHGDNEPAQNGTGYFGYFNGHDGAGTPNSAGQAGTDTATEQGWYSYDLGKWHIVSLNAECDSKPFGNDCSTTGNGLLAQETQWLAKDLKDSHQPCTLAYWHQPTFSSSNPGDASTPASAPGVDSTEGKATDAWWKLLYADHATLVLNGHEHLYARTRPMNPAGGYDPKRGIPEFIIGTGGEGLDSLAKKTDGSFSNQNVLTGQDGAYGVTDFTLKPNGYAWSYKPTRLGAGQPASTMSYSDSGTGSCHAAD